MHVRWVYLLKEKSEATKTVKDFHSMIQNQYNTNIQIFHIDNGKAYFNFILGDFFFHKRESYTKIHVQIPLNKMVLLKEKIVISLK